jgi:hypothetical protein
MFVTRVDHGGRAWHSVPVNHPQPMTTNRFWNSVALLVLMFMFYGIGVATGRDQAAMHPACHQNLKP